MAARKFHGIFAAFFGTAANAVTTELQKLDASKAKIEFLDQDGNPTNVYGNQYAGVQYAKVTIPTLDAAGLATVNTRWQNDQGTFFKLLLDGGETWTTTVGTLLTSCKPIDIEGQAKGRADGGEIVFQLPVSLFTIVTA